MRRLRAVVPFGMLMMYFPSISEVTRRRFTGNPFASAEGWLAAETECEGGKKTKGVKNNEVWALSRCLCLRRAEK